MIHRTWTSASIVDVLDRVLDNGIIIDGWVRVSPLGIDLITVEAHVAVASVETYEKHFDSLLVQKGEAASIVAK